MARSGNSKDKLKIEIIEREINKFGRLIKGHIKILTEIGKLQQI